MFQFQFVTFQLTSLTRQTWQQVDENAHSNYGFNGETPYKIGLGFIVVLIAIQAFTKLGLKSHNHEGLGKCILFFKRRIFPKTLSNIRIRVAKSYFKFYITLKNTAIKLVTFASNRIFVSMNLRANSWLQITKFFSQFI